MKFSETPLAGAFVIDQERHADSRGFFARTFCAREFATHGLQTEWPQCNVSENHVAGTLRGMHWQAAPHGEEKLVRCTRGAIWDCIVDLRGDSPTYLQHFGVTLGEENGTMLYIPRGFGHGFITLADDTQVFYQMGNYFEGSAARGLRYNDPALGIVWPRDVAVISERDASYPDYAGERE